MPDLNTLLNLLTLIGVAILFVLRTTTQAALTKAAELGVTEGFEKANFDARLSRTAIETAVKTASEEGVRDAIEAADFPAKLDRELQKARGLERQELRYQGYGGLWKELRPLAIYDVSNISKKTTAELSTKLSDWYFSQCGGLLLTPHARDFYFALQDLLHITSRLPDDWEAIRSEAEGSQKPVFRAMLASRKAGAALKLMDYLENGALEDWQQVAVDFGKGWREDIKATAHGWHELDAEQRFATLQQVGSVLRTALVSDLDSRMR